MIVAPGRRRMLAASAGMAGALLAARPADAASGLDAISSQDALQALRTALERGTATAVSSLGKPDGFLGNPKVRIPLPGFLNDAAKLLRAMGRSRQVDELETAMNRAAEAAVPQARDLLVSAVRSMSVGDARKILTGSDTSVTEFFAGKTRDPLTQRFLPIVARSTRQVGLAAKYNEVAGKAAGSGLVRQEDADIDHYVARKSLDALYAMIGEEERRIRKDPVGTGSAILGKVFGALR